jgi:Lrp/AsnC family transcriptional regulator, leucine-responsive regulatory protein
MVGNLGLKDKKILIELDTNATQPLNRIAKKLRLSREVVAYRIKQMEQRGIILSYNTLSHFAKTGMVHFKLYVKYSRISQQQRKEIIAYLVKFKNVGWLVSAEGLFDLMLAIRFRDVYEFEQFKDRFFQLYDKYFHEVKFAILTEAETKPRYYILPQTNLRPTLFLHCDEASITPLDKTDRKVLSAISGHARDSYTSLARKTGLSERVIRYRRHELEKKGVIVGYKLKIDYRKLNYLFFKCFLTLRKMTPERYRAFRSYVRLHQNIIYWIKIVGPWDAELEIEVPSVEEFYEVANEIKDKFSDIVDTFDSSLVSKEHILVHA